jgi:hypothetical protein
MTAEQPDWLKLHFDLLETIAERSRDAVTGFAAFCSVCRTWRSAVKPAAAPRLVLPVPQNGADPRGDSNYAIVFPLSCGWSIVVDVRDVSCHLKHLPTGATAALPKLNAVRDSLTSEITHLGYEHASESDHEGGPFPDEDSSCGDDSFLSCGDDYVDQDQETSSLDGGDPDNDDDSSTEEKGPSPEEFSESVDPDSSNENYSTDDDEAPADDANGGEPDDDWHRRFKIKITYIYSSLIYLDNYLQLSDMFNFAIHIPPGTPPGSTEGMVIMMYHMLQGNTGMVFCRPGDGASAWTKIANPNSEYFSFSDFAYLEGKMLALDDKGVALVFDATTLELLYQVDVPPATTNFTCKIFGYDLDEFHCLRLVALPSKVLLVKVRVKASKPEGFEIFELSSSGSGEDGGGKAWRKVIGDDIGGSGSHELFLDCYHTSFREARDSRGTRIYFHDDFLLAPVGSCAAYCYNMRDNKLECVYMPPAGDSGCVYSTRPTWFVPTI